MHLYEEHGVDCVRHLHGMFAFALWDRKRRQRLLLARDRVGKKPLFYALPRRRRSGVRVGAARAARGPLEIARDVDPRAVDRFLAYGYVPAPMSIFSARAQAAAGPHAGARGRAR